MLTVAKVTGQAAVGYADYLEGKTQATGLGDYYLKDGERVEAPGRWIAGAGTVGCDPVRPVAPGDLRELMAVRRPDDGRPLRQAGAGGQTVAALDATFSAPKSVSAAWALADRELRERIELAHEAAIDRAMTYSVGQVAMIRQRVDAKTVTHQKPAGVVATSWRHTTARAVNGRLPDPQLHSHVLLHAAVRKDGRVVAIDSRSWLVHRREVGAAYRTELARELAQLGFAVRRGTGRAGRYFEIDGIPQLLLDRWSSRRREVQEAIEGRLRDQQADLVEQIAAGGPEATEAAERLELLLEHGQLAPSEERSLSMQTRGGKAPLTSQDLDEHWEQDAATVGVSRCDVTRIRGQEPVLMTSVHGEQLLKGLTEFDAAFPARDARAVALEQAAGIPIQDALDTLRQLREDGQILRLADGTGTTREHRGREHEVLATARALTEQTTAPVASQTVTGEMRRLDRELRQKHGRLSDEQRDAIHLACGARPLVMIEGQAGTGKSTTLTAIARAHHEQGQSIIVTSTAALAAERLGRVLQDAGVPARAYSIAALGAGIRAGAIELNARSTIIHDEAALASTLEQRTLLGVVQDSGARLIKVGDPAQNPPVGAGGLWPHLRAAARDAGAYAQLTINQRARDPADRRDQARFRDGQQELAIRGYAARDRIHHTTDAVRAEDLALEAAHADTTTRLSTIVIAQTSNERLDQLNARYQAIRQEHGELGEDASALAGRPYELHVGDQVQVRRTLTREGQEPLRNGTVGEVGFVDVRRDEIHLHVGGEDRRPIVLDRDQIDHADLRLAYVQHPMPAQGRTTDTAHLIIAEHATRAGAYVAITRARRETHLYADTADTDPTADRLAVLAQRISHDEPDLPSINTPLTREDAITFASDEHLASAYERQEPGARRTEALTAAATSQDEDLTTAARTRGNEATENATVLESGTGASDGLNPARDIGQAPAEDRSDRRWPRRTSHVLASGDHSIEAPTADRDDTTAGWEV